MKTLKLSEDYAGLIRDNAIDGVVVLTMTSANDWRDLGLKKFGDIRKCVAGVLEYK